MINKSSILVMLLFSAFVLIFFFLKLLIQQNEGFFIGTSQSRPTLQLGRIKPEEKTPLPPRETTQTPVNICPHNSGGPVSDPNCYCYSRKVLCDGATCIAVLPSAWDPNGASCSEYGQWCRSTMFGENPDGSPAGVDGVICVAKPVIYLYPKQEMLIDVEIKTYGEIVVSDPLYRDNGWKNVLAHPSGNLIYEGKSYRELFYESEVNEVLKPTNGIIISSSEIDERLSGILFDLGLNSFESNEFRNFWVPKLKDLKSNYVLFSLLEKDTKEAIDHVVITPEPDTRIEFIAYFKPMNVLRPVKALILPKRPGRLGFTMVEWGGFIEDGKIY